MDDAMSDTEIARRLNHLEVKLDDLISMLHGKPGTLGMVSKVTSFLSL